MSSDFSSRQNQKRQVYEMGLAIFCQCCTRAPRVKERLQNLLLDLIKKERDGEKIDRDLVRSVTQMLLDMGKAVFTEDFEQPFLTSSDQYYQMWTESRISNCSTPEYLKNVDNRIQEEAERVKACVQAQIADNLAARRPGQMHAHRRGAHQLMRVVS